LQVTLGNVAASIAAALIVGIIAATIVHALPAVRRVLEPLFGTYYAIPMFAFYPLLIVLFGLGNLPQVAIGFLLGVMAVVINTLNGLDRVPHVFDKVAHVLRLDAGAPRGGLGSHTRRRTSSPASSSPSRIRLSASSGPSSLRRARAWAIRSPLRTTISTTTRCTR